MSEEFTINGQTERAVSNNDILPVLAQYEQYRTLTVSTV